MIAGLSELDSTIVQTILKEYNLQDVKYKVIDSYENYIYELLTDEPLILRISHSAKRDPESIMAELDWINYLSDNMDVRKPIQSKNGNEMECIQNGDHDLYAVIFKKVEGKTLSDTYPEDVIIKKWGKLTARMHEITKKYIPEGKRRIDWKMVDEVNKIDDILDLHPEILKKYHKLIQKIDYLPKEEFGLIHQDLHDENLILNGERLYIIDFDDSLYHYFIADIAAILFHTAWRFGKGDRNELVKKFFPIFIDGYKSVRNLSEYWIEKIDDFIQLRFYNLFSTCVKEDKIEKDEHVTSIIKNWQPMLEKDVKWIDVDFLTLVH